MSVVAPPTRRVQAADFAGLFAPASPVDGATVFDHGLAGDGRAMDHDDFTSVVQARAGMPRRRDAEHAVRAVLVALRRRLPEREALRLARKLPSGVSPYLRGTVAAMVPASTARDDDFIAQVSEQLGMTAPQAVAVVRAVLAVVDEATRRGLSSMDRLRVPEDVRPFLPPRSGGQPAGGNSAPEPLAGTRCRSA